MQPPSKLCLGVALLAIALALLLPSYHAASVAKREARIVLRSSDSASSASIDSASDQADSVSPTSGNDEDSASSDSSDDDSSADGANMAVGGANVAAPAGIQEANPPAPADLDKDAPPAAGGDQQVASAALVSGPDCGDGWPDKDGNGGDVPCDPFRLRKINNGDEAPPQWEKDGPQAGGR